MRLVEACPQSNRTPASPVIWLDIRLRARGGGEGSRIGEDRGDADLCMWCNATLEIGECDGPAEVRGRHDAKRAGQGNSKKLEWLDLGGWGDQREESKIETIIDSKIPRLITIL